MKAKRYLAGSLALTAFLTLSFIGWLDFNHAGSFPNAAVAAAGNHQSGQQNAHSPAARRAPGYGQLPLRFEANGGQSDARVRFIARGSGYALFLTADEAVLRLLQADGERTKAEQRAAPFSAPPSSTATLRMRLLDANTRPRIVAQEELTTRSNYFTGDDPRRWHTNVANFARVKYEGVYPGVDLIWHGNQQQLEHDFIVAPGADPARIKLSFSGAEQISVDQRGDLLLAVAGGVLRLLKPQAWQELDGGRRAVACDFRLGARGQVGFRLGAYDARQQLVIDPVLAYSTYLGGAAFDQTLGIAVDGAGNAYLAGLTTSTDFPGASPLQASNGGQTDAFVVKLNLAGNAVVYATW